MPYSEKKAKKIYKRVQRVGVHEAALEFGVSEGSIERACRMARNEKDVYHSVKNLVDSTEDGPILIIPDTHIPYHNKDMIPFLKWVQETKGCRTRVIHVGDMLDFHSMSRHVNEPDCMSPEEEYERAMDFVAEFTEAFPLGDLVLGNHDAIPQRQMKEVGLAPSMLKDARDLYGLPSGWDVHPLYYVIDGWNVLVEHGIGSGGKMGCLNTAILKRCSYVQGHTHSNAAVMFSSNYNSTIFGMNVGWLGDEGSLAVRYAKYATKKGVLGCGVVYSGEYAEFIPIEAWKNK